MFDIINFYFISENYEINSVHFFTSQKKSEIERN